MGGGGDTTNVSQISGLADQQYQTLQSGQQAIRGDIQSVGNQTQQGLSRISTDLGTGFANVNSGLGQVNNNLGQVNANVVGGFNAANASLNRLDSNVQTGLNNLNNNMGTGFNNLNNNLTNTASQLNQNVQSGFTGVLNQNTQNANAILQGQQKGFSDTNANMAKGFADNTANVNTRFDAQGRQIETGLNQVNTNMDAFKAATLNSQNDIRGLVERYGGNLDKYYADLAASQADQTTRLGGLQTGLASFQSDWEKADQLANQQRARIADSVAGGFNTVRTDMANNANAANVQSQRLGSQITNVNTAIEDGQRQTSTDFARVARQLTVGFDDGSRQTAEAKQDFTDRLTVIRRALSDQELQIDAGLRQTYTDISNSFDQTGRLITRSTDDQGNQIARAIDQQGNLLLAAFSPAGDRVGQQAYNINQALNALDRIGYRPARVASPYVNTQ